MLAGFLTVAVLIVMLKFSFAPEYGIQAPNFEAELIDGTKFKLSNLKGKYVVLDFWGSWCGPCIKESPKLVELSHKFKDRAEIVSIALEKESNSWKKVSQKFGYNWKYQIVDINSFVLMSSIAQKYGVSEIPAKFLISPEGELLGKFSFDEIDKILQNGD